MNPKQGTLALTEAGAVVDPHGWLSVITVMAPLVAMCTVAIVLMLCVTIVVLVRSTERSQRLPAIKALAPTLLTLASHFIGWRPSSGKP